MFVLFYTVFFIELIVSDSMKNFEHLPVQKLPLRRFVLGQLIVYVSLESLAIAVFFTFVTNVMSLSLSASMAF